MDLCELAQLPGASGDEDQIRNRLLSDLQPLCEKLSIDSLGNIIATKGEHKPGPRVMIAAHMDEPGLIITGVHDTGLLYFSQVGSIDVQTLLGCRVVIGHKGIDGVIGGKPIHLLHGEERSKMPKVDDLFIDIGAENKQVAEALVHVGDYATFSTECAKFGEGMVKGKALASRIGCYALLQVLTMDLPYPVYGVFAVQKEVGLRGARIAGYRVNPHLAFILDSVSCTDLPGVPEEHRGATLGAGPVIRLSDKNGILDLPLSRWIAALATQASIPCQWQSSNSDTSNASAVQLARDGVRVADLAVPCRYADSPLNVIAQSDVSNTIKLIRTVLEQTTSFNLASQ